MNLTRQSAEIILLMRDPELVLINRKGRNVGSHPDRDYYCQGACVAKVEDGKEITVKAYHGRMAHLMVESGILVEKDKLPFDGVLYTLSDLARDLPVDVLHWAMQDRTRILLANVNKIAAKYGVRVGKVVARKMYYLEPLAGQVLSNVYMPYHPDDAGKKDARLITKINDLDYDEWETLIIDTLRRNAIPGVTDGSY